MRSSHCDELPDLHADEAHGHGRPVHRCSSVLGRYRSTSRDCCLTALARYVVDLLDLEALVNGRLAVDRAGYPVLLADPPEPPSPSSPELTTGSKRRDLVRELAREFEDLSIQDLRERSDVLTAASELAQLQMEVRAQVLDDLVDVLDQRHRGRLRARRTVRLQAPKGYTKKLLNSLSEIESGDVASRLRARGWTADDIKRTLPRHSDS